MCKIGHMTSSSKHQKAKRLLTPPTISPDILAFWSETVTALADEISSGTSPCDYSGWLNALSDIVIPPEARLPLLPDLQPAHALMYIAETIAHPPWPEDRHSQVRFALAFLEADVMLFRSGYAKSRLIDRLRQSALNTDQIVQVDKQLRRSIINGCGLQECRAYSRLAAKLAVDGHLSDLIDWLETTAQGAILTTSRCRGKIADTFTDRFHTDAAFADKLTKRQWLTGRGFSICAWGVAYPDMTAIVPAGTAVWEQDQQQKHSAYLMLRSIKTRLSQNSR